MESFKKVKRGVTASIEDVTSTLSRRLSGLKRIPVVALQIDGDAELDVPEEIELITEFRIHFFDSPRKLAFFRKRSDGSPACSMKPFEQLRFVKQMLDDCLDTPKSSSLPPDGPQMWPLHGRQEQNAILALDALTNFMSKKASIFGGLVWLRICRPPDEENFIEALRSTYGPRQSFHFEWAGFYIQLLWPLSVLCVIWLVIGADINPDVTHGNLGAEEYHEEGHRKIKWEACKALVLAWALVGNYIGWRRHGRGHAAKVAPDESDLRFPANPQTRVKAPGSTLSGSVRLVLLGVPLLLLIFIGCYGISVAAVVLVNYLIYDWGRCFEHGPTCLGPQDEHGFLGWLAEVAVDIVVAIVFEIFFAVSAPLAKEVARCKGLLNERDRLSLEEELLTCISIIERVGIYAIIALDFVPQFEEPGSRDDVDYSRSCEDLYFGSLSFRCYIRRLPIDTRRFLLWRILKGPFFVAPFVSIIMKLLVPFVAERFDWWMRILMICPCRCCDAALDAVARICALLFIYDGSSVGCLRFIRHGWPFDKMAIIRRQAMITSVDGTRTLSGEITAMHLGDETDIISSEEVRVCGLHSEWCKVPAGERRCVPVQLDEGGGFGWSSGGDEHRRKPRWQKTNLLEVEFDGKQIIWHCYFNAVGRGGALDVGLPPFETCQVCKTLGSLFDASSKARAEDLLAEYEDGKCFDGVLQEAVRKPYEPGDELMELKLYFVWVIMFIPIMPIGIFTMLVARILESHTDLTKLLYARRRVFPADHELWGSSQIAFGWCAISIGAAWSLMLSLLTYNNNVWTWTEREKSLPRVFFWSWCLFSTSLLLDRRKIVGKPMEALFPLVVSLIVGLFLHFFFAGIDEA